MDPSAPFVFSITGYHSEGALCGAAVFPACTGCLSTWPGDVLGRQDSWHEAPDKTLSDWTVGVHRQAKGGVYLVLYLVLPSLSNDLVSSMLQTYLFDSRNPEKQSLSSFWTF